ncbi:hypothetical protein D3C86_2193600 [compost metagenome]
MKLSLLYIRETMIAAAFFKSGFKVLPAGNASAVSGIAWSLQQLHKENLPAISGCLPFTTVSAKVWCCRH